MNSDLNYILTRQRASDAQRAGDRERLANDARSARHYKPASHDSPVTIRWSTPADVARIIKISELDSRNRPPGEPALVAELGNEMVAILSLETGDVAANPFRHTAHAVALLRVRANQLTTTRRSIRTGLRRLRLARPIAESR
jgi:hypothetical protein